MNIEYNVSIVCGDWVDIVHRMSAKVMVSSCKHHLLVSHADVDGMQATKKQDSHMLLSPHVHILR